ncbi:MAG: hypothetical protein RJA16_1063, partial [Planctomycetota bacterium]
MRHLGRFVSLGLVASLATIVVAVTEVHSSPR